ncbi:MAG: 50S ribosomal protein L3 [Candidatus Aenigmatarchaeota archaeon]
MPNVRRPKRGSRAFYPRTRASRPYPRIEKWPRSNEVKPLGVAGYKAGMTHAMAIDTNTNSKTKGQLISRPVTVLDCPPLSVFGFKAYSNTTQGLKCIADVLASNLDKNLGRKFAAKKIKPLDEQLKRLDGQRLSSVRLLVHTKPGFKKTPEAFELAIGGPAEKQLEYAKNVLGKELRATDVLKEGDFTDVFSITSGHGFEGPVNRFGIRVHSRKAQQMARKVGGKGTTSPGKVRSTVPQAGQHGWQSRMEFNKKIMKIAKPEDVTPAGGFLRYGKASGDAVLLEGSVAGPAKRLIRLRSPMRPPKTKYPVDIRLISKESKQGV